MLPYSSNQNENQIAPASCNLRNKIAENTLLPTASNEIGPEFCEQTGSMFLQNDRSHRDRNGQLVSCIAWRLPNKTVHGSETSAVKKKERRARKTATVASCQHVGTESFLQAFRHKRTDHRHSSELFVHIAFQNLGGIPSVPAAFRRFRDFKLLRPRIWKFSKPTMDHHMVNVVAL